MKVMHVLNSRIYSGAEKVVCQIIKSFRDDVEMVYCSPDSDIVRQMLSEQGVTFLPMETMSTAELKRVISEQKPDLIHAHDMRASFFSALCCGKIPLVSHIHNNAYDARGLSPKTIAYLLAGFKAKHILWVSNSSYEGYAFHKFFAKKSSVLYNIIDTEQIFEKKAKDENTYDYDMIYVGRLTYQKDPQRLMRLCARLKERKPDLKVAIVGTGELLEEVQNLCAELGIQDHVHFLGYRTDAPELYKACDLFAFVTFREGLSVALMEAMSSGMPTVCSAARGNTDLIENGKEGLIVDNEPRALADAILTLYHEPDTRRRFGQAAARKVQQFDRVNVHRIMKDIYLSL